MFLDDTRYRQAAAVERFGRCGTFGLPALLALLTLLAGISPAAAQPEFRGIALVGVSDGVGPGVIVPASDFQTNPIPVNVSVLGFRQAYPNGVFSGTAAANYRGFWSTGTYAAGEVTSASYPTTTPTQGVYDQPFGYYVLGGMGSYTKHRFVSPESLSGPFARFRWKVSGTAASTLGTAASRLDFAVTQGATSFDDLYNASITPNLLTEFGPGTYQYTTGIALDTPLDFMFWSSAFWSVTAADMLALQSGARTISGQAEFMNTFTLDAIDLFNSDGSKVTNWSLLDEATGRTIFTQAGRVTALDSASAPEPSSLAFLLPIAAGMIGWRRRHARQSESGSRPKGRCDRDKME